MAFSTTIREDRFTLSGLRMTDALDEVRESIQRNLDEKKGGSRKSNSADSLTASTEAWTKFGPNKRQSETT